jgi:hypothetical protein
MARARNINEILNSGNLPNVSQPTNVYEILNHKSETKLSPQLFKHTSKIPESIKIPEPTKPQLTKQQEFRNAVTNLDSPLKSLNMGRKESTKQQNSNSNFLVKNVVKPFMALEKGFVDAATLGMADKISREIGEESMYNVKGFGNVRKQAPKTAIAGKMLGYALPYNAGKKVVASKVSKLLGKANTPVKRFLAERAVDAPLDISMGLIEGANRDYSAKETAKNIGMDLALGTGIDAITNAYKGLKEFRNAKKADLLDLPKTNTEKVEIPQKQTKQIEVPGVKEVVNKPQVPQHQVSKMNLDQQTSIEQLDDYIKQAQELIETTNDPQIKANLQLFSEKAKKKAENLRRFIDNSIMNSQVVPDEIKEFYKQNPSLYEYQPISNKGMLDNTREIVGDNPENFIDDFMELKSLRNADDTVLGEVLIQKFIEDGNYQRAINTSTRLAQLLTNAGQQVQAASIMKRMTPEGMLHYANKQIEKFKAESPESKIVDDVVSKAKKIADSDLTSAQKETKLKQLLKEKGIRVKKDDFDKIKQYVDLGGFENVKFKTLVENKLGLPTLTESDVRKIVNSMNNIQDMDNSRLKDIEIGKVMQLIANKIPVGASEKFKSYLRLSMLFNPKTLITRNPLGNITFGALENVRQPITGLADMATSKIFKTDRSTSLLPNLKEQGKGFVQGFKDLVEDTRLGIDTSSSRGGYELPRTRKVFGDSTVGKGLNTLHNTMGTLLQLGDRPFFQGAYQQRLAELKRLRKTNEINADMIEDATNYALERVFQNKGKAVNLARYMKKGLNNVNIKGLGLGDVAMPFTETPANILARGIEYSPLGILRTIKEAPTKNKLLTETFNQKSFVDSIGRNMTGSAIALLGYKLAKDGLATGQSEKSEKLKALDKVRGIRQYSIKFGGDKTYTFDWAQPASLPMAIGVDFYNAGKSEKDLSEALEKGAESGVNTLFRQSFLQGVNRMMGGYSPASGIKETILSAPLMALPTVLNQATQMSDKYSREVDYGGIKGLKQSALRRLPIASKTLYPKIDVFGNEIKNYQGRSGIGKFGEVFFSPGYYNKINDNAVTKELVRLNKSSGSNNILPKVVKDFSYKGRLINLTDKEKYKMQKYMGKTTFTEMNKLINSPYYKSLNENNKEKALSNLVADIYNASKERVVKGREN